MLRTIFLLFASLGLLLATLNVRAQQGPPDAGGVWVGYLGSGLGLELRLEQDGQGLSGSGLLQQADLNNPFFLDMGGEISNQGNALLQLQGRSLGDDKNARFSLEVRFLGDQAEARLLDLNGSGSQSLMLTRRFRAPKPDDVLPEIPKLWNNDLVPFDRYNPTEIYMLDLGARVNRYNEKGSFLYTGIQPVHIRLELSGNLISEVAGSWRLQEQDDSRGVLLALNPSLTYRDGRVAAWNYLLSNDYSRVILKTPDTISFLADLVFPRLKSGTVGSSSFQRAEPDDDPRHYVRLTIGNTENLHQSATSVTATLLRN